MYPILAKINASAPEGLFTINSSAIFRHHVRSSYLPPFSPDNAQDDYFPAFRHFDAHSLFSPFYTLISIRARHALTPLVSIFIIASFCDGAMKSSSITRDGSFHGTASLPCRASSILCWSGSPTPVSFARRGSSPITALFTARFHMRARRVRVKQRSAESRQRGLSILAPPIFTTSCYDVLSLSAFLDAMSCRRSSQQET